VSEPNEGSDNLAAVGRCGAGLNLEKWQALRGLL
jgi:hypothetical protein